MWLFLSHTFEAAAPSFAPLGLGFKQVVILAVLDKQDTPRDLREMLGAPASTISNLLNELERKGLIERQIHPEDRRQYRVVRTEAGEEILQAGIALVEAAIHAQMATLSPEDRDAMLRCQKVFAKLVDEPC